MLSINLRGLISQYMINSLIYYHPKYKPTSETHFCTPQYTVLHIFCNDNLINVSCVSSPIDISLLRAGADSLVINISLTPSTVPGIYKFLSVE